MRVDTLAPFYLFHFFSVSALSQSGRLLSHYLLIHFLPKRFLVAFSSLLLVSFSVIVAIIDIFQSIFVFISMI